MCSKKHNLYHLKIWKIAANILAKNPVLIAIATAATTTTVAPAIGSTGETGLPGVTGVSVVGV